jgi:hypothetical protein
LFQLALPCQLLFFFSLKKACGSIGLISLLHCRYVKVPIFTLCVGNAWGEAALLLAAGAKGNRAALPSSTIMIKQVISFSCVDI